MGSRNITTSKPKKAKRDWGRIIFIVMGAIIGILFLMEPILSAFSR